MAKWDPLLKGVQDPPGEDSPAWVKRGMEMSKRAQRGPHPLQPPIVSVQPMTQPIGGLAFYDRYLRPRWEPSAVDRLAALTEPNGELAKRIAGYDKIGKFKYFGVDRGSES
jgi:hypothetical protein